MRIVFMGTPDFAVPALRAILDAGHTVLSVYCQPPRPAGRGHKLRPSPVQRCAEEHGLPVATPARLRNAEAQASFAALEADIAVVAAYGLILPQPILQAPRLGCINIHASLLPRWRGAAPIHRAILAGDEETGISIMQMEEGLDTGPVLLSASTPIGPTTTTGQLHDVLAALGAELVVEALDGLAAEKLRPVPQPAEGVLYAEKIDKTESRLDWRLPAVRLERQIRAFTPFPGAWFPLGDERLKVLAADVDETQAAAAPGTVLDNQLTIACGRKALRLLRLQPAGRSAMDSAAYLRGNSVPVGTVLPVPAENEAGEAPATGTTAEPEQETDPAPDLTFETQPEPGASRP